MKTIFLISLKKHSPFLSEGALKLLAPILVIMSLFPTAGLHAQTISVLYLERPPYYYTVNGRAAGFLADRTRKLFRSAGVSAKFTEMPPKRIIKSIQSNTGQYCSIGWFKNPERERFAKFSLPIYQNKPIVILTTRNHSGMFQSYASLKAVFSEKSLILGVMSEFSYGPFIDSLMENHSPSKVEITSKQSLLPSLIVKGRASYMLISPEEVETLLQSAGHQTDNFVSITMPDIPAGNKRYLMFSMGVSDETIAKIDQAILRHSDPNIARSGEIE